MQAMYKPRHINDVYSMHKRKSKKKPTKGLTITLSDDCECNITGKRYIHCV